MTTLQVICGEGQVAAPDPAKIESVERLRREDFILAAIPIMSFERVLHLGCADGSLTLRLPGASILGIIPPSQIVESSTQNGVGCDRVRFACTDVAHVAQASMEAFDLIVVTGGMDTATGVSFPIACGALLRLAKSGAFIIHDRSARPIRPSLPLRRIDQFIYRLGNELQILEIFIA
ncbi:hypothetical protein PQI07_32725 [Methylobacterium sp. 092160098-2]|uniref:hypothetical protein n=1 Tax=Methylobacterium sp. 092160098-2 TaxID=3025129 RepID=UPI00238199BA|nr:hypothetical protein [Methylobacterium sp. 092160098-2]MDE4915348.1 hypothetical protein [Methylobacterium sp. 092160098-2]